jgi:hypothetical protein
MVHPPNTAISAEARASAGGIRYSVRTLVNDFKEYATMCRSLQVGGFMAPDREYLYLDNTAKNQFDAYAGINLFLRVARGTHIIICHQDVRLIEDGRDKLDSIIAELDTLDPAWGMFGNAGGLEGGGLARRISDRWGDDQNTIRPLPVRVVSLDENFIVVRQDANLAVSRDLHGFHLYGTELSLVAERLGHHVYVVDFHLRHLGSGVMDSSFYDARYALILKCRAACRWR